MGSILRNFVLAPAAMAAAALATNTAMAETLKVPFTFTVDGKDFPAGLYSVQRQEFPKSGDADKQRRIAELHLGCRSGRSCSNGYRRDSEI
jgi:hypothetical protein